MKLLHRIASFVSWHRRAVAAVLAGLCVAGVVSVAQSPPPGDPVLVAARPLPVGHTITAGDVTLSEVPPRLVTPGTLKDPQAALGSTTAIALEAGQVLTRSTMLSSDPSRDGRALVPIAVQDPALRSLLEPGTTVSLLVALGERPEVVTDSARVAKLPSQEGGGLSLPSGSGMVVVEVPSEVAGEVAALGQSGQLVIVLGAL